MRGRQVGSSFLRVKLFISKLSYAAVQRGNKKKKKKYCVGVWVALVVEENTENNSLPFLEFFSKASSSPLIATSTRETFEFTPRIDEVRILFPFDLREQRHTEQLNFSFFCFPSFPWISREADRVPVNCEANNKNSLESSDGYLFLLNPSKKYKQFY